MDNHDRALIADAGLFVTSRDGAALHCRRSGEGPGLVLLHGAMRTAGSFSKLARDLSADFTVIAVDRRGRRPSASAGDDFSLQQEVDDLSAVLEQTRAAYVFGQSSGALITLKAALGGAPVAKIALYEPPLVIAGARPSPLDLMPACEKALAAGDLAKALVVIFKAVDDPSWFMSLPGFILTPLFRRLLTRVAPLVMVDDTFALKGGIAINLFVRDMPRLSVDLDLVFPDHMLPREDALRRINQTIRQSVARLKKQGFQTHAPASRDAGETKLLVRQGAIEVKIEVNFVMRGTVNPVRMMSLTQSARDTLQADLEIPVVSLDDLHGENWLRRWIGSILVTCSTSCSSWRMKESRRAFAALSSSISQAIPGRFMRCCFPRCATSARSSSTISRA